MFRILYFDLVLWDIKLQRVMGSNPNFRRLPSGILPLASPSEMPQTSTCSSITSKLTASPLSQSIRLDEGTLDSEPGVTLTSMGSRSLAMEGERERDLRWDLESSSRDGVLEGVKLSTESTWERGEPGSRRRRRRNRKYQKHNRRRDGRFRKISKRE